MTDTPTPTLTAASPAKAPDQKLLLPLLAGAFLLGGALGISIARKFIVPRVPPFPKVAHPCPECDKRRALEAEAANRARAEAAIQAERQRLGHIPRPTSPVPEPEYGPEDLDDDGEAVVFDQTKVENPKVFSPHSPSDG